MFKLLFLLVVSVNFTLASECADAYKHKIANLNKIIGAPRTKAINTATSGVATQLALGSAGLSTSVGLITAGVGILAGGITYGVIRHRLGQFQAVLKLYKQVELGKGKFYLKAEKFLKKRGLELDEDFIDYIRDGVELNTFCEFDYSNDKVRILKFKKVLKNYLI